MSVFTNPASAAPEHAQAYVTAVLELVGDQDPLGMLAEMPDWLDGVVAEMSPEALAEPEAPGKWSVLEVLAHLADSEIVFGYRVRRLLADERPFLAGYDQDLWADAFGYAEADARECLGLIRWSRAATLRLLRRASPEDFRRISIHAERGEEPLDRIVRLYAGHDVVHRRQIERIRRALEAPGRVAPEPRTESAS